jgi:glycolate oxidase iron-sulfur subunit
MEEFERGGLDAVVVNASGCGTMIKDYGYLLRSEPSMASSAARISMMARDITELMSEIGVTAPTIQTGCRVAYHNPCSMHHGQRIRGAPRELLRRVGFDVLDIPEEHICCGSAGTYSVLQPELSGQLRARKLQNIASVNADVIASGNVGCIVQLASGSPIPVVHTVELLDWATGGIKPSAMR